MKHNLCLALWLFTGACMGSPSMAQQLRLPGSEQVVEARWLEASEGKHAFTNRLVLSDSAYLKQHADNPIDWYPWQEAAFARANAENKLIFLSIGYASCHWCHVMEKESFADTEVAEALIRSFVSIKVDREQHPDIDAYYNLMVETIKGESGWPITIILLPDRSPAFAANYLDKPSLLTALERLSTFWQQQPGAMKMNAELLSGEVERRYQTKSKASATSDKSWVKTASDRLLEDIDSLHGGFGTSNKFPSELKLQFLLSAYKQNKDPELKQQLVEQLDTLMQSGMTDIVFGGVFRYTTDRQMSRPHFEKMLYNQASMVSLYADAGKWLNRAEYSQFADSIIQFTTNHMRLENGAYAAAIDADHLGQEGGYYLWPKTALTGLPAGIQQVTFENGLQYLYGASSDAQTNAWLSQLQMQRSESPRVIQNQVTAWNSLWLLALLRADDVSDAINLAETLWDNQWRDGRLYRLGNQQGFLDDYSYYSNALWRLYLATADKQWKTRARLIDQAILKLFYHEGDLSYRNREMPGNLPVDVFRDSELPSPLATALRSFAFHQTDLEFIQAFDTLKADANAKIGNRPERHLSLVQLSTTEPAEPQRMFAKGHGMIALTKENKPGLLRISIYLDEDWHINADTVLDSQLVATQISGDGVKDVMFPAGESLVTEFSDQPLSVFSGNLSIDITMNNHRKSHSLQVRLQACSSRLCLLPESFQVSIP